MINQALWTRSLSRKNDLHFNAHTSSPLVVLQLSSLYISDNIIMGTFPSTWSNLEQVRVLLLSLHCVTTTLSVS